jgi:hypothetical protein
MPTTLSATVHRTGQSAFNGVTRNLSPYGAFVDIGHHTSPLEIGIVEIEFLEAPLQNLRIKGLIVHSDNGGIGVMFSDTDLNERTAIKEAISS